MFRHTISNSDNVIDSRDIIQRIKELEDLGEDIDNDEDLDEDLDEDSELAALKALAEEAEQYSEDWSYGSTLIRDSYFTEYTQELLEDCGDIPRNIPHYVVIDWDATADNIQSDYSSVDFDGVTYWI